MVVGFVAAARFRVQFVQNLPFVRHLAVTLMDVPKTEVSIEPFTKKLSNVLDLPVIQKFVKVDVTAACVRYIAPKSLTINFAQMLTGDDDSNGKSNLYIVLAYAKFGKPLHATHIIQSDLNPVKGEENLSVMLWDSDKHSADNLIGRVTVLVVKLMKDKEESPNILSVAKEKHEQVQKKHTVAGSQEETDALRTPPDLNIPRGVLSVVIHQINNRRISKVFLAGVKIGIFHTS
ncbi:uncharacterized protein PHACADRAFT_201690 [Phanerochaete carnosa HHB-10118-sp]|uniref:Uncharacterized protein n=1 Tax=Phanerochaete carnosa (strain HHB-10118-sp) TaxID=650164 RepID=K5VRP7_PHACS|nr:uncharacterized protein PHACADRAFT_201690 [Phanerochaete carnosa HHB-10118-sp]EKM49430.1 hypothetical protein PHACADRAFT_201690 [Phanerochaete carnosa HHB-10118-sp]